MSLIVLYDPEEHNPRNDNYGITSANPMFDEPEIHYWARRSGNPFEDLAVLWINRKAQANGSHIFSTILEQVWENIDHMYIWDSENPLEIEGHVEFRDWDRRNDADVLNYLRSFSTQHVFLAVEMTEQTPFGTSALQRWYRILECVRSGIPTVYALPGRGTYNSNAGLGTKTQIAQDTWPITNQEIKRLINENQPVTREAIEDGCGQEFRTTPHNLSEHLLPDMYALWDAYDTPCITMLLPEAYPFICDQYAWSGCQLQPLWDIIQASLDQAQGGQEMDYHECRRTMWQTITGREYSRTDDYDAICNQTQFPRPLVISDNPNPTEITHHRSIRSRWPTLGHARDIAYVSAITTHLWRDVLVSINASREEYQNELDEVRDLATGNTIKTLLSQRNQLVVCRINADWVGHTNYKFNGPRYDLNYTRLSSNQGRMGVQLSPYARSAVYVIQTDLTLAGFSQLSESALAQYSTADLLSLSDGLYPGPIWWPRGTDNHRFAPPFAEVAP